MPVPRPAKVGDDGRPEANRRWCMVGNARHLRAGAVRSGPLSLQFPDPEAFMRPTFFVSFCITAALLIALPAVAAVTNLVATIDGAQANAGAGTGSPATGSAVVTYDSDTGELTWNITWSGLIGDETLAHFHGPALPNQNAGVQVTIFNDGSPSPAMGSAMISGAQATELLDELWYINIHTSEFGGGEIRGQVMIDDSVPVEDRSISRVKSAYE